VVEPAAAERQQDEEHHVGEDRGREQQPPAVKRCAGLVAARLGGRLYWLRRLALPDQDQRGKKPDRRGGEVGAAPANDAVQEQGREQHDVEVAGEMRKAYAADEASLGTARNRKRELDGLSHVCVLILLLSCSRESGASSNP